MTHCVLKSRTSLDDVRSRKKNDPKMIHYGDGTAVFKSNPSRIYDNVHEGFKPECDMVKRREKCMAT